MGERLTGTLTPGARSGRARRVPAKRSLALVVQTLRTDPDRLSPGDVVALQRLVGNRTVAARVGTSGAALQRASLADPATQGAYAATAQAELDLWDGHTSGDRFAALKAAASAALTSAAVPVLPRIELGGSSGFNRGQWLITVDRTPYDSLRGGAGFAAGPPVNTLYHEARHVDQIWAASRWLAAQDTGKSWFEQKMAGGKENLRQLQVRAQLQVPEDVARRAYRTPFSGATQAAASGEAAGFAKAIKGTDAVTKTMHATSKALAEGRAAFGTILVAKNAEFDDLGWSAVPLTDKQAAAALLRQEWAKVEALMDDFAAAYRAYRDLATEADAYDQGGAVERQAGPHAGVTQSVDAAIDARRNWWAVPFYRAALAKANPPALSASSASVGVQAAAVQCHAVPEDLVSLLAEGRPSAEVAEEVAQPAPR